MPFYIPSVYKIVYKGDAWLYKAIHRATIMKISFSICWE